MEVKRQLPAVPPAGATQAFQRGDNAAMPEAATKTGLLYLYTGLLYPYEEKASIATLTMNSARLTN